MFKAKGRLLTLFILFLLKCPVSILSQEVNEFEHVIDWSDFEPQVFYTILFFLWWHINKVNCVSYPSWVNTWQAAEYFMTRLVASEGIFVSPNVFNIVGILLILIINFFLDLIIKGNFWIILVCKRFLNKFIFCYFYTACLRIFYFVKARIKWLVRSRFESALEFVSFLQQLIE